MRKDLVEKIRTQLKSLFTQKFTEVKAGDLMISTPDEVLGVGSEVFMIDEEGLNVPLSDGEYLLDSGEKIEVVAGKVTEISAAEMEEKEEEVVEEVVEAAEEEEKVEEVVEEPKEEEKMGEKIAKMEAELAELKKMVTEMMAEKEVMKEEFSKIAQQPAVKSIEVKPSEFKSVEDKKTASSNVDLSSILDKAKKKVRG